MKRGRLIALIFAGLFCVVGHQACEKVSMDGGGTVVSQASSGGGNGIGDEGKPQHYFYYDEQAA